MMPSVAIIGAGISGLAAAHEFQDAGFVVTLFEKDGEVGGRAATRKQSGFIYDHGAQYIKEGSATTMAFITERFYTPDQIDIQKPIWIFDGAGHIQEGDPKQNAERRLSYRHGLSTLSKQMAHGLSIELKTRIASLHRHPASWTLINEQQRAYTGFDMLLVTLPAPLAASLIAASQLGNNNLSQTILHGLGQASYHPLISVTLGYAYLPHPRPYYALVNTDKKHPISWLAWEHEKSPERVPPGSGLLIAQMAPSYSQQHMHDSDEMISTEVAQQVSTLLEEELSFPTLTDVQRWHNALPATKADALKLNTTTYPHQLAFCGDSFVGGRIHLALEHGIMVSRQLIGH
jgi:predicted NAD/FAD-dependent oxidoreductase